MSHLKNTSADKTSLGFEYQDLVLVHELLRLEQGQSVGLELYDDVHTESVENELVLMQIKHSLRGGNITERDIDLWKTIYNWYESIGELPKDKEVRFILYTNKALNSQELITLLSDSKNKKAEIIAKIASIHLELQDAEAKKAKTESTNALLKYAQALSGAAAKDIEYILDRFSFYASDADIISKIDNALEYLAVPIERIEETRRHVIGAYKDFKFSEIKSGAKVIIDFDCFRNRMGFNRILQLARSGEADFNRFYDFYFAKKDRNNLSFLNSIFGQQLAEIGVGAAVVIERGIDMVITEDLISQLKKEGTFSDVEDKRLESQTEYAWSRVHQSNHGGTYACDADHNKAAYKCWNETMAKDLTVKSTTLPEGVRAGKYIKLSDTPLIGWRADWEAKYKK